MPTRDLLLLIRPIKRKYWNVDLSSLRTFTFCSSFCVILMGLCGTTDMYEVPDAVPPIHVESSHVATDKDPSK